MIKKRVLILDNDQEQLALFTRILKTANYKVIITEDELELIKLIENEYPDVILISDNLSKQKNIYSICQTIKSSNLAENIPIIFINGKQDLLAKEMMFNAGASDYINYPFSSIEILNKIDNQFQIKTLQEQLKEKTSQLQKLIPYYKKLKLALEKTQLKLNNLTQKDQENIFANQQKFEQTLEKEWLRGARQRSSFGDVTQANISVIVAQLNNFDSYQDYHEAQLVQNCLELVSEALTTIVKRPGDLVANLDQGKFAILLPNTASEGAKAVAEKIQTELDDLKIPHNYCNLSEYMSFSIGIANGIPTQGLPPTLLIEVANNALTKSLNSKTKNAIEIDNI